MPASNGSDVYTQSRLGRPCGFQDALRYTAGLSPRGATTSNMRVGTFIHEGLAELRQGLPRTMEKPADADEFEWAFALGLVDGYEASQIEEVLTLYDFIATEKPWALDLAPWGLKARLAGVFDDIAIPRDSPLGPDPSFGLGAHRSSPPETDSLDVRLLWETKSTASSIDDGSSYWWPVENMNLQLDTYNAVGSLLGHHFAGAIYDVIRKPKLTVRDGDTPEIYRERTRDHVLKKPEMYYRRRRVLPSPYVDEVLAELVLKIQVLGAQARDYSGCMDAYRNTCAFTTHCAEYRTAEHTAQKIIDAGTFDVKEWVHFELKREDIYGDQA